MRRSIPFCLFGLVFFLFTLQEQGIGAEARPSIDRQQILAKAAGIRRSQKKLPSIDSKAAEDLGLLVLSGQRIKIFTDLPNEPIIKEYPQLLDQALIELCSFFELPESILTDMKLDVFLIKDRGPFKKLGVLNNIPFVQNGYSNRNRIFVIDQKFEYYNRFLLIHEMTHSFMYAIFGRLAPPWYYEGIAEYLALHRWKDGELQLAWRPKSEEETPGFARLRLIQKEFKANKNTGPEKIFAFLPEDYGGSSLPYAWSWSMVTFLYSHPSYRTQIKELPYFMMEEDPDRTIRQKIEKEKNGFLFDWNDFVRHIDFQYDFARAISDKTPGKPLSDRYERTFGADRRWQNSGLMLTADKSYRITATGEYTIEDSRKDLLCEPDGVTLRYYQGYPLGRLLGTLYTEDGPLDPTIHSVGSSTTIRPKRSGTLFLRINESGGKIARVKGSFTIRVELVPDERK